MVKIRYLLFIALLPAAAAAAYTFLSQSDTARIEKQIGRLAEIACKNGLEYDFASRRTARKISRMFADNCVINAPGYGISGMFEPGDIAASLTDIRRQHKEIDLVLYDVKVTEIGESAAAAICTAEMTCMPVSGFPSRDFHEISLRLEKKGRDWLFSDIHIVNVLER